MKTFLLILFTGVSAFSQSFIAGEIGTSVHAGLTRPTIGFVSGKQWERMATEVSLFNLCKKDGGCGYETSIRNSVKLNHLALGIIYSHYQVVRYKKSAVFIFAGLRFGEVEFNYLHDLTSPNRIRSGEIRFTHFGKNHLFLRVTGNVGWFRQVNRRLMLIENSTAIGVWW